MRIGLNWCALVYIDSGVRIRPGSVSISLHWIGLGLLWTEMNENGLDWLIGLDWSVNFGSDWVTVVLIACSWISFDWLGLDQGRTRLGWFGSVWSPLPLVGADWFELVCTCWIGLDWFGTLLDWNE